jgi:Tic22-like family
VKALVFALIYFRIAPDGKTMKSLVRLGAILGIVGSTLLGPSPIDNMSALALPETQIVEKLDIVPVFTIADAQGVAVVNSVTQQGQSTPISVGLIFISQRDAQSFINRELKANNPQLASTARVIPLSLGKIYQLSRANKDKPNELQFDYIATPQQVESAKTLLRQAGQQVNEFNGVPLFYAKVGTDNGVLTFQQGQKQVIPFFFNKEELQAEVDRFKQQQPNVADIKIAVVNLEGFLETLRTQNDPALNQIIMIPSRESRDYVRSLQPAGSGNQIPQPAPNQIRPAPQSPAPNQTQPAPRSPAPAPSQTRPAPR